MATKPKATEYHVEVLPNTAGRSYWRIKTRNGRIVATSGEDYTRPRDAVRAARDFVDGFRRAVVVIYEP